MTSQLLNNASPARTSTPQQEDLIPVDPADAEETFSMTTAQLLMKFPDLRPPAFVPEECRKMSEEKRYNGERWEREHPEACKWLVKALASGNLSSREIERISGAKYYVQKAIADRHQLRIKEHRNHLANMNSMVAEMALEREMELIPKCGSLSQVSMAKGIAVDKEMALRGDAVLKIDINHTVDFGEKAMELGKQIGELQSKILERLNSSNHESTPINTNLKTIEAEVIP